MERQGVPFRTAYEQKMDRDCFSTDMGNVTYVVPSIHPTFEVCSLRVCITETQAFADHRRSSAQEGRYIRQTMPMRHGLRTRMTER